MLHKALSFLLGICLLQTQAELPGTGFCLFLGSGLLILPLAARFSRTHHARRLVTTTGFFVAGLLWATLHGQHYLDKRLPESLAGVDMRVEGVIEGIPGKQDRVRRFMLKITQFGDGSIADAPEKIRLSWYYGKPVNAGERWQFVVRLKPPHGFMNPGGFDYEAWLYQHRIHATGYVRKSTENRRLENASLFSVDSYRQKLSEHIRHVLGNDSMTGPVSALAVGDRSLISSEDWDVLIKTGTNHLMAISGLHIGLAAAFAYWWVRRLTPVRIMKKVSSQQLSIVAGLIFGFIYALLAGMSIPTQRALIMLFCVAGAWLLKRNYIGLNSLATALLLVLIWDPVSVLSPGFWFSFLAVFTIYYVFSGRVGQNARWKQWGWIQFAIALGLFPVSLLLFQQTSLAGPLANLVAVPYVSMLVVPLVLLALLIMPISVPVSDLLLQLSNTLLEFIWPFLSYLSQSPFSHWTHAAPDLVSVVLALGGVFLLLAPRGVPAKWLGVVLVIPVLTAQQVKIGEDAFELSMLDVGQGLAAVIRTQNHVLVFDTGNQLGDRLDAGKAVIIPYLRQAQVKHIDRLVISHGDADHIGGAGSVLSNLSVGELVGQEIESLQHPVKKACLAGQHWRWDGVDFEFLHPGETRYKRQNNKSCVLKITGTGGSVLITGDIEKKVEYQLLARQKQQSADFLKSGVLVVPHHGSKTSSSRLFIEAVQPEIVLFPVGYRNRYRHPNAEVLERYMQTGAAIYSIGYSGGIKILIDPESGISVIDEYRKNHSKYWNHEVSFLDDETFGHSHKSSKI